jgi:hypothetical protein
MHLKAKLIRTFFHLYPIFNHNSIFNAIVASIINKNVSSIEKKNITKDQKVNNQILTEERQLFVNQMVNNCCRTKNNYDYPIIKNQNSILHFKKKFKLYESNVGLALSSC